jgi:hypothetical protein
VTSSSAIAGGACVGAGVDEIATAKPVLDLVTE